jgi:adenylate cyclase
LTSPNFELSLKRIKSSYQLRTKIYSIAYITLFWLILSLFQYVDRYIHLLNNNCGDDSYMEFPSISIVFVGVILGGLTVGSSLVFVWGKWLRKVGFVKAIIFISLSYLLLFILIGITLFIIYRETSVLIPSNLTISSVIVDTFTSFKALPNFLFWLFIILLTQLFLVIRDQFDPNVFLRFMTGQYFTPKREERIFMFMDLKSATAIAEQIGEINYFNFLNETFKAASEGIVARKGEIYQYIGDEIVVSWKNKTGLSNANCINCFYEITENLEANKNYFINTYGVAPVFKAGLHSGFVTAGEMGNVKREIVYSGDVLNTTSRIQTLCNKFNVNLLCSSVLADQLPANALNKSAISLGVHQLKGKQKEVELISFK